VGIPFLLFLYLKGRLALLSEIDKNNGESTFYIPYANLTKIMSLKASF
jgi:hypothetical protein